MKLLLVKTSILLNRFEIYHDEELVGNVECKGVFRRDGKANIYGMKWKFISRGIKNVNTEIINDQDKVVASTTSYDFNMRSKLIDENVKINFNAKSVSVNGKVVIEFKKLKNRSFKMKREIIVNDEKIVLKDFPFLIPCGVYGISRYESIDSLLEGSSSGIAHGA